MASKNEAKVRFTAETGDFNDAIKQANSELGKLRSELKLNSAEMKTAGSSADLLAQKQKILAQEANATQTKIDALSGKLEKARDIYGANSTEAQRLETQLNNAKTAYQRIQSEIDSTNSALEEQKSAASQAESAMGKLESTISKQESELKSLKGAYSNVVLEQGEASSEAQQMASRITSLSKDLEQNKSHLNEARTAADRLEKEFDQAGQAARDMGSDLDAADVALGNLGADAIEGVVSSLAGLEESTRQYRNEQNKMEAVAQHSGQDLNALKDSYSDLYAITGDETLASTAVLNMSAMGTSVKDQQSLIKSATGAWAAYGDSIHLDGLLESINETTRAGQVTASFADVLNWANMTNKEWSSALAGNSKAQAAFNKGIEDGMTVEDAFNEALKACSDTGERQQLVTAAMDKAYGELGQTYQETNQDVIQANEAQLKMQDGLAAVGEAIQPVTSWFQSLIGDGLQWFVDNLPVLTPLLAGLAAGFAAFMVVTVIAPAVSALVTGLGGLAGVMAILTSPVTLVVAAIALLAAGFVALYQNSETFRNGVQQVWTTIQTVFGTLAEWFMTNVVTPIVTYFQSLWPQIQAIWDGISNIISIAMTAISGFISNNMGTIQAIWSSIWGVISSVAGTVWGVIQNVINTALGVIQGIITTVTGIISGDWSMVWQGISQVASSIWNGIKGTISTVLNGIKGVISNILNGIKTTFSSVFNGVKSTVSNVFNGIKNTITNVINGAKNTVKNGLDAIKGFFSGLTLKLPDIKLPHFSISGSFSLNPPSIPTIGVQWYAKGGILNAPTIFGAMGGKLLGGGEAGKEAVLPIDRLQGYIDVAFQRNMSNDGYGELIDAVKELASRDTVLNVNGKEFARATAADSDRVNGSRQLLKKRGVSLA